MRNILFALGYSQYSETYFRYTQIVAKQFGSKITVIHVYDKPEPTLIVEERLADNSYLKSIINEDQIKGRSRNQELNRLNDFLAKTKRDEFTDIEIEVIVKGGDTIIEIEQAMQSDKYDLLIMGMRKHSLSERIFGGITHSILSVIDKPILLIPPDAIYSGITNIIYATAFDLEHMIDIQRLEKWRKVFDANLEVVYVAEKEDAAEGSRKLARLLDNAKIEQSDKVSTKILTGSVVDVLNDHIRLSDADLFALHRKNRGFWSELRSKSITKEFIEQMIIPILIFKNN